jgi:hypothetical protein
MSLVTPVLKTTAVVVFIAGLPVGAMFCVAGLGGVVVKEAGDRIWGLLSSTPTTATTTTEKQSADNVETQSADNVETQSADDVETQSADNTATHTFNGVDTPMLVPTQAKQAAEELARRNELSA